MANLEEQLTGWTAPSSDSEQEKQDRTERMIRDAVTWHQSFADSSLRVFAKGSYANKTNIRVDSDVDIAVECYEAVYNAESQPGLIAPGVAYEGPWTPERLRQELAIALETKFPGQVDTSGTTAIRIRSNSVRVNADVVPCFTYRYHLPHTVREGVKIFRSTGNSIINFPAQQLEKGRAKNRATNHAFKHAVRLLKRVQQSLCEEGLCRPMPSYFVECLAYNCPNHVFSVPTWTEVLRGMLAHIYSYAEAGEPSDESRRWLEVNECFFLFHPSQRWTRTDARSLAIAAWNHFGFE